MVWEENINFTLWCQEEKCQGVGEFLKIFSYKKISATKACIFWVALEEKENIFLKINLFIINLIYYALLILKIKRLIFLNLLDYRN